MSCSTGEYSLEILKLTETTYFLGSSQGSYKLARFGPQPQLYPVILPSKKYRFDFQVSKIVDNELIFNLSAYQSFRET
jgi:hypothetical protein